MSYNVKVERKNKEVRNVQKSTHIGGGCPGQYWTRSVKAAIKDGRLAPGYGTSCNDYKCANSCCNNNRNSHIMVAGHVFLDGALRVHKQYLVPICNACNAKHDLRFVVSSLL